MGQIIEAIRGTEWSVLIIICLTLGLAPFNPPHIYEKIMMLISGTLKRPLDWFDLFMHATPFFLLLIKVVITFLIPEKG
jgi:hypothetical protein